MGKQNKEEEEEAEEEGEEEDYTYKKYLVQLILQW